MMNGTNEQSEANAASGGNRWFVTTTAYCGEQRRVRLIGARPRYVTISVPLIGVPAATRACRRTSRSVSPRGAEIRPVAPAGAGLALAGAGITLAGTLADEVPRACAGA